MATKFAKEQLGDNLTVVEIGVRRGPNALNMYKSLDIKKLYLVDPYCSFPKPGGGTLDFSSLENMARKLVGNKSGVVFLKETSETASKHVPDHLDFIYIDGDHRYDAVKQDLTCWYPKIRKGGVLAGHDFNMLHKEVHRAVTDFVKEKSLSFYNGESDWWVIK